MSHEKRDVIQEDVFYPDHERRTESATFRHTKAAGHKARLPCAISGRREGVEYHHLFIEWALAEAVDWGRVKAIALGEITEIPVLDAITDQPTLDTYPANQSLCYVICKLAEARGFDWKSFDPCCPETFVDSMANMLVLEKRFHVHRDHGIHNMTMPEWIFQAWPRRDGFVYTPDEVVK